MVNGLHLLWKLWRPSKDPVKVRLLQTILFDMTIWAGEVLFPASDLCTKLLKRDLFSSIVEFYRSLKLPANWLN